MEPPKMGALEKQKQNNTWDTSVKREVLKKLSEKQREKLQCNSSGLFFKPSSMLNRLR